jgi:HD-like signal output (HDOD) protein
LRLSAADASEPVRLVQMLCDARIGGDEICLRIERDSVLCAQVLRIANSPYYGQQRTVSSIRQALLLLGFDAVRGIASAACVAQMMPKRIPALRDISAVLRHSLATAVACELLAASRVPALIPQAFMAGLLHNLGTLVQGVVDCAGVTALIAARGANDRELRELEKEHVAIGHEAAAAIVFEAWQLPDSLIAAASHHHHPAEAPEAQRTLVSLVALAADLALACGSTFALEPVQLSEPRHQAEIGTLRLSAAEFAESCEEVRQRLTRFGPLLNS